jgi:hypothetical protein
MVRKGEYNELPVQRGLARRILESMFGAPREKAEGWDMGLEGYAEKTK